MQVTGFGPVRMVLVTVFWMIKSMITIGKAVEYGS